MPEQMELRVNGTRLGSVRSHSCCSDCGGGGGVQKVCQRGIARPLCGMGICFECRAAIDGRSYCRTCQVLCRRHGNNQLMSSEPVIVIGIKSEFDVIVIGAGPAGLAAAACAAESARVGRVGRLASSTTIPLQGDRSGGRVCKEPSSHASPWISRLRSRRSARICGARVSISLNPAVLLAEGADHLLELSYRKLIVATGAREMFLPFSWLDFAQREGTGGLQAMVKSGLPIAGKRVLVAGSGPLLLAVAAYLRQHGAEIPMICEQASRNSLARFGVLRSCAGLGKCVRDLPCASSSREFHLCRTPGRSRPEAIRCSRMS